MNYNATGCKDCKNRHIGCHAKCDIYKAYLEDKESKRKAYRKKVYYEGIGYYHK